MKKYLAVCLLSILFLTGCTSNPEYDFEDDFEQSSYGYYNDSSNTAYDYYDDGYEWAEDNDIEDFDDCQDKFGTSDAEDGCNDYVRDNYTGYQSFYGYDCTEDCSGHEAGYEWAEENGIYDVYDCDGNSQSFIEGCQAYVEENY